MIKKELIEILKDFPDDAKIYVEADHGQTPESAGYILVADSEEGLEYYAVNADWKGIGIYENKIQAILIGA